MIDTRVEVHDKRLFDFWRWTAVAVVDLTREPGKDTTLTVRGPGRLTRRAAARDLPETIDRMEGLLARLTMKGYFG